MKIPENMTEKEVIEKIDVVINRMAHKYTFHGYDVDDIKQESFIICLDALERYDCKRPLENFLSVHLSNRLKNFIRDNYFIDNNHSKKKILAATPLSYEHNVIDEIESDLDLNIDIDNIKEIIDTHLPIEYRSDYLKLIHNVTIPKNRRTILINLIKKILEDNDYA